MGRMSRDKGASFERHVAKLVRATFLVSPKECYRTPLSGGHPYGDCGDLVIGNNLLPAFPFTVEAKHHRDFRLDWFFTGHKKLDAWMQQVIQANWTQVSKRTRSKKAATLLPLLVMRGHATPIYVATPDLTQILLPGEYTIALRRADSKWEVALFTELLQRLKERAGK